MSAVHPAGKTTLPAEGLSACGIGIVTSSLRQTSSPQNLILHPLPNGDLLIPNTPLVRTLFRFHLTLSLSLALCSNGSWIPLVLTGPLRHHVYPDATT